MHPSGGGGEEKDSSGRNEDHSLPKGDFRLSMLFVTQEYPLSVK